MSCNALTGWKGCHNSVLATVARWHVPFTKLENKHGKAHDEIPCACLLWHWSRPVRTLQPTRLLGQVLSSTDIKWRPISKDPFEMDFSYCPTFIQDVQRFNLTPTKLSRKAAICPHQDHDKVIKWNPFPRYWPFVRGILLTKASNAELWCFLWSALDLRHHRSHCGVTAMELIILARSLDHCIDLNLPEYSGLSTRRDKFVVSGYINNTQSINIVWMLKQLFFKEKSWSGLKFGSDGH